MANDKAKPQLKYDVFIRLPTENELQACDCVLFVIFLFCFSVFSLYIFFFVLFISFLYLRQVYMQHVFRFVSFAMFFAGAFAIPKAIDI